MKKISYIIFIIILLQTAIAANQIELEEIDEIFTGNIYQGTFSLIYEDNLLYIVGQYGLEIYSTNEEGIDQQLSILPINNVIRNIFKIDNYLALHGTNGSSNTLYQVDVTNPTEPEIINQIESLPNVMFYIKNSNNYFYYSPSNSNTFYFLDPISFEVVHQQSFESPPIWLKDNYYILVNTSEDYLLDIYDFSDFANIQYVSSIQYDGTDGQGVYITPITDSTLVLHNRLHTRFYDISEIENITLTSEYCLENPAIGSFSYGIKKIDEYLLVTKPTQGIEVIDISDLSNPTFSSEVELIVETNLEFDGSYLYTANMNGKIYKFEFDQGFLYNQVVEIDNFTYLFDPIIIGETLITPLGSYEDEEKLLFWDISNPLLPEIVQTYSGNHVFWYKQYNNGYFYSKYSNQFENGISILDISNLENIYIIEQMPESSVIRDLDLDQENERLFSLNSGLYNDYIELKIYDIVEDTNLELSSETQYSSIPAHQPIFGTISEDQAYVTVGNQLKIFDDIQNGNLNLVSTINNNTDFAIPYIRDEYLVLIGFRSCHVYSLADYSEPSLIMEIQGKSVTGNPYIENDVLILQVENQLQLFDLTEAGNIQPYAIFPLNSTNASLVKFTQNSNNYLFSAQSSCLSIYEYDYTSQLEENTLLLQPTLTNYPNPFTPATAGARTASTTINYSLSQEGQAEITIYNLKGQKIKTLLREQQPVGKHTITWDGRNENDKAVASGVYLYQLQVDGQSVARQKMMLVK
jgi:hypothetical protein